jgi:two-component system cell cycle sensor histidine kinase PleC
LTTFDELSPAEQDYLSEVLKLAGHEFATPLSLVTGYLRFLLNDQNTPLNERHREWAERALEASGRIHALVKEISEFRRLGDNELKLVPQEVDFNELITELASGVHADDGRHVRVEAVTCEAPLQVRGDRARLAVAVQSLMRAAVRERGTPGVIVAESSVANEDGGTWAVLAIGDATLLERLRRTRDDAFEYEWQGGMGLALPFARRIIEAHGGSLWSVKNDTSRAASALRLPLRT